jgi:hypothetical protein
MSDASLQTQGDLEAQPVMPVRRLNNFVYCPRLFYFQWVENIFQESADTVAGSLLHRHVDAPSRLEDEKAKALAENLPEGARLRSRIPGWHRRPACLVQRPAGRTGGTGIIAPSRRDGRASGPCYPSNPIATAPPRA